MNDIKERLVIIDTPMWDALVALRDADRAEQGFIPIRGSVGKPEAVEALCALLNIEPRIWITQTQDSG